MTAGSWDVCNSIPRNRIIDDMTKVDGGSDSDDRGVTGTKGPSEGHERFYNERSDESHDPSERHPASTLSSRERGDQQSCTDSEIRCMLNALPDEDVDAIL